MQNPSGIKLSTRLAILLAVLISLSTILAAASSISLPASQAQQISGQVNSIQPTTENIFLNNVQIAIQELIPGYGPVFSLIVTYQTGQALSAIAQTSGQGRISGLDSFFLLLLTPIYWLEFFSYSLAVEESISVVLAIAKRDFLRTEWRWIVGSVLTIVVVLLVSAQLEYVLVRFFS